jgi:hypothetical protein
MRYSYSNLSIETVRINHDTKYSHYILWPTCKVLLCDTDRFGVDQSDGKYVELRFSIKILRRAARIKL